MEIDIANLAAGGTISAVGLLILKFLQERRTDRTTAVEEWRAMNDERKEDISALRKELDEERRLRRDAENEIDQLKRRVREMEEARFELAREGKS